MRENTDFTCNLCAETEHLDDDVGIPGAANVEYEIRPCNVALLRRMRGQEYIDSLLLLQKIH